ncbi:MAG: pyruvate, phosphate dikinase [Polyangiaceae bacterium]|nr:pyruvate, phosphate dikinase [Polyangiaceae bacterium]
MNPSTGIANLDRVLHGLRAGDNIVWTVDSVDDYSSFVDVFSRAVLDRGEPLVYFRFASHRELVPREPGVRRVVLNPGAGFEQFITQIHQVIAEVGQNGNYVFDMFSDLMRDWYSERMVGNFFLLTCPYLLALDTIAYFGVLRNYHSYHAIKPISDTTQLFLDVHRHKGRLYIHPLKVDQRYSPTMYMIHEWDGEALNPVTQSALISEIEAHQAWPGLNSASYRMVGMWDRRFMQAEETLNAHQRGETNARAVEEAFERLTTQILTRDEHILPLVRRYLTLDDIIYAWKRVIGSGMIGGKALGMLLARAILRRDSPRLNEILEPHDSFFIGSDIFYMFLVHNGCWWIRQKQKDPATLLDGVNEARRLILQGTFPDYIISRFSDMLDYFGQSPIIVRSSSLLEDNFGNAFAGKYDSVFCANQGTHQQRLQDFLNAVRVVYASAMSEEAVRYRALRGVLDQDEQMALLVQRVSGAQYGRLYYPQLAGVGFSANPYVWHSDIDPEAGVLRVVFGLGTRAVERSDDDYTRVVALNAPHKRPESGGGDLRRYAQRRVDYLDLDSNQLTSGYFDDVVARSPGLDPAYFAQAEPIPQQGAGPERKHWFVQLDPLFDNTPLIDDMRAMLRVLRAAYQHHVDIEFTMNLMRDRSYRINLLQCRPLQMQTSSDVPVTPQPRPDPDSIVIEAHGAVLGCSRSFDIDRVIYVVPSRYSALPVQQRYAVARLIGQLTHAHDPSEQPTIMLVGPGRWGTKMPELGVPVSFADINTASVLCEIDAMHEGLVPDLSLATHFFHELVELNMLYLGYFGARAGNRLNLDFLEGAPNRLGELVSDAGKWSDTVRVLFPPEARRLRLTANHMQQEATLYLAPR